MITMMHYLFAFSASVLAVSATPHTAAQARLRPHHGARLERLRSVEPCVPCMAVLPRAARPRR